MPHAAVDPLAKFAGYFMVAIYFGVLMVLFIVLGWAVKGLIKSVLSLIRKDF